MFCKLATGQKTAKLFKLNTFQPSAPDGVGTGEGEEGGAGMVVDKHKLDKNKAADLNEQLKMSFARLRRYQLWDWHASCVEKMDEREIRMIDLKLAPPSYPHYRPPRLYNDRAERDYKGDMEALSLQIEQVRHHLCFCMVNRK